MSTLVRVQGLSHRDTREKVKRFPIIVETYIIDMFLLDMSDDFVQFSIKVDKVDLLIYKIFLF